MGVGTSGTLGVQGVGALDAKDVTTNYHVGPYGTSVPFYGSEGASMILGRKQKENECGAEERAQVHTAFIPVRGPKLGTMCSGLLS